MLDAKNILLNTFKKKIVTFLSDDVHDFLTTGQNVLYQNSYFSKIKIMQQNAPTFSNINSCMDDKIYTPIHMTLGDLLLWMLEVRCCGKKCLPMENLHAAVQESRILTDSAWKRNRKQVLGNYNKTRINIRPPTWPLDGIEGSVKCKHQCHCACSWKFGHA